jgi:hypothetical protein
LVQLLSYWFSLVHVVTTAFVIVLTTVLVDIQQPASIGQGAADRPAPSDDVTPGFWITWLDSGQSVVETRSLLPLPRLATVIYIGFWITWLDSDQSTAAFGFLPVMRVWVIKRGLWVHKTRIWISNRFWVTELEPDPDQRWILGHRTLRSMMDSGHIMQVTSCRSHQAGLANQRRVNHWVKYSKSDQPTISIKFKEKADSVWNRLVWSTNCLSVCSF